MGVVALVFGIGTGILSFKYRREIRSGVRVVYNNVSKRIEFVRTHRERLSELEELSNEMDKQWAKQWAQVEELKRKQNKIDKEHEEISQSIDKLEADNEKYIEEHGTPEEFNEWMDNIRKLEKATDQCRLMKERHNMVMNSLSDPFNNTYTEEQRAANIENIDAAVKKAQENFEEINAKCEAYTTKYNIKGRPREGDVSEEEPGNFIVNVDELNGASNEVG